MATLNSKVGFRVSKTIAQAKATDYLSQAANQGIIHFTDDSSKTGDSREIAQRIILNGIDYTGIKKITVANENPFCITVDGTPIRIPGLGSAAGCETTAFATAAQGALAATAVQPATLAGYQTLITKNNPIGIDCVDGVGPAAGCGVADTVEATEDSDYLPTSSVVKALIKTATQSLPTTGALDSYQKKITTTNKLSSSLVDGLGGAAAKGVSTSNTADADNTNVPTVGKVNDLIKTAVTGASNYLGTITSKSSLSTTAKKGDFYRVSNATAANWSGSPQDIHVGDILIAEKDNPTQTFFSESNQNGWSILHNEIMPTAAYQLSVNKGKYGNISAVQNATTIQDALNYLETAVGTKLTKNTAITAATKCKITYDANGLVTGGTDLTANDIPTLGSDKITVTSAKYGGSANTTALQNALNNLSTAVGNAATAASNAASAASAAQTSANSALTYLTWD